MIEFTKHLKGSYVLGNDQHFYFEYFLKKKCFGQKGTTKIVLALWVLQAW